MVELRKTGTNQYEVVVEEQVIGQVWNWHGTWSAQADNKVHHGLKSRKEAIAKVEHEGINPQWNISSFLFPSSEITVATC